MIHLTNNYWGITVPENIWTYGLGIAAMYKGKPYLCYDTLGQFDDTRVWLPPGSYSIVGIAKDLTEGKAGEIVEEFRDEWGFFGYKNYSKEFSPLDVNVEKATTSLSSLLRSKSLAPETTLIILKTE